MRSIKPPAGRSVLVVGDEPLIAGNLWAGISKKSREARLVKFADTISNLRAFAVSPPAGWSNDRRLGYLDSCRNLMDAGRGSNTKIERIFDDTAKAVEQAIRTEDLGDIDSSTSARREFEAAIGQSVHLVYIPNTRCRPLGEGRRHLREPTQIDAPSRRDPHPKRYSFITRVRSGYGPGWTGLQTRSV